MTITGTQLALTTARANCSRVGCTRVGYATRYTRSTTTGSVAGPLVYWRRVYRPTVVWTKVSR